MSHSGKTESLFGQSSNRLNQQNRHFSANQKGHSDSPLLRDEREPFEVPNVGQIAIVQDASGARDGLDHAGAARLSCSRNSFSKNRNPYLSETFFSDIYPSIGEVSSVIDLTSVATNSPCLLSIAAPSKHRPDRHNQPW